MQIKTLFTAVLALTLVACASAGKLTSKQERIEDISPGSSVALKVEPVVENKKAIHDEAARELRAMLFGRLVSEGVFSSVVQAGEAADYAMDVKLHGARKVSTGARIFLGVMAGPDTIAVEVDLMNTSGNLIQAFEVTATSAAHPLSSESGMGSALREASEKVIEALR